MFIKSLMALAGSAAIAITGPAVAAPGGNGGGGPHGGSGGMGNANAGMNTNGLGAMQASPNASFNRSTTNPATDTTINSNGTAALQNSQGPNHASPTGIAHANQNSVLARGAVSSTALAGLTTGLTVQNSSGTTIGTVSQVVTGTNGSIRLVVVTSPTGQTFRLAPSTLSLSGGVVTTTSTSVGP
jgi:hypothetical protein